MQAIHRPGFRVGSVAARLLNSAQPLGSRQRLVGFGPGVECQWRERAASCLSFTSTSGPADICSTGLSLLLHTNSDGVCVSSSQNAFRMYYSA
jgi:hypothetical protein